MGNARRLLASAMLAVGMLALMGSSAWATQRYASPTGSGTACTIASPCDARYAISNTSPPNPVADGDEVILLHSASPYDFGNSSEVSITRSIDVHGEAGFADPVLNGGSMSGLVRLANGTATLHDVDIEYGGAPPDGGVAGLIVTGGTAYRLVAHTLSAGAQACALAGNTTAPDALIRDSLCWGEGNSGIGVGLACQCSSFNGKLRNVDAFGTEYGIRFESQLTNQTFAIDARNVIADGGAEDVVAKGGISGQTNVHADITLDHSAYDSYSTSLVGTNSSAFVTPTGADPTNVAATPAQMLVSPLTGDFHQLATSPTINAGTTDSLTGTTDLDGNVRPQGPAMDIGAYEAPVSSSAPGGGGSPATPPFGTRKKCKKTKKKKHHRAAAAKKCKKRKK